MSRKTVTSLEKINCAINTSKHIFFYIIHSHLKELIISRELVKILYTIGSCILLIYCVSFGLYNYAGRCHIHGPKKVLAIITHFLTDCIFCCKSVNAYIYDDELHRIFSTLYYSNSD